jgi:hypothetical protein
MRDGGRALRLTPATQLSFYAPKGKPAESVEPALMELWKSVKAKLR